VIKFNKKGRSIESTILESQDFFSRSGWASANNFIFNRISRISKISDYPILYVGSAPSKRTGLRGRYKDLSTRRHTVFYSILALLVADWELEYGWKRSKSPEKLEKELIHEYKKLSQ